MFTHPSASLNMIVLLKRGVLTREDPTRYLPSLYKNSVPPLAAVDPPPSCHVNHLYPSYKAKRDDSISYLPTNFTTLFVLPELWSTDERRKIR